MSELHAALAECISAIESCPPEFEDVPLMLLLDERIAQIEDRLLAMDECAGAIHAALASAMRRPL